MRLRLQLPIPAVWFACFALTALTAHGACSLIPMRVRCEYRVDPRGIDAPAPRLDWLLQPVDPAAHGLTQSAYEVVAASSPALLAADRGDLWDSGKVLSDQTIQVP